MGRRIVVRDARDGAHQLLAVEACFLGLIIHNGQHVVSMPESSSHAFGQSVLITGLDHHLVDDDVDAMVLVTVKFES